MACQCSTLLPEQIIEAFNDAAKSWQICSISCIQTNQSSHHPLDNNTNTATSHCHTALSVTVLNTTDVIPSIPCTDFNKKWRFLSPSKLAHPPRSQIRFPQPTICKQTPQQTVERRKNINAPCSIDDVSSQEDNDDDNDLHNTNNKRKRKFTQFTNNNRNNNNTQNTPPHALSLPDITLISPDATKTDDNSASYSSSEDHATTANSQPVAKRRRLNNSNHILNPMPKSFLNMTRAKKKKKHPTPPVIMQRDALVSDHKSNTNTHSNNGTTDQKPLAGYMPAVMPTSCTHLMYNVERKVAVKKSYVMAPTKPPTPVKKSTGRLEDESAFDALDQFRSKHEDKFPSLATIEKLCGVRRYDAKKIALRYFECRDSEREYILMETNEYRCTKCHQQYTNDGLGVDSLTKIKTHVILHTEDAFKCPVCSKPFVNEHHLMYHIRQKKDARNAHKEYYQKHYADSKPATKSKRKKKVKKSKESAQQMQGHMAYGGYQPSYHDYNVNKSVKHLDHNNTLAMHGPPPLSPVSNEEVVVPPLPSAPSAMAESNSNDINNNNNNSNHNNADAVVEYTCPASPYDVAPLPISTTAPGQEVFKIVEVETKEKEKEYPPVPLAPN